MNIKSEKRYRTYYVTDFDIVYVGGLHDQITVTDADLVEHQPDAITFTIREPKSLKTLEEITCLKRNMASWKRRVRLVKVEDKTPINVDIPPGD